MIRRLTNLAHSTRLPIFSRHRFADRKAISYRSLLQWY